MRPVTAAGIALILSGLSVCPSLALSLYDQPLMPNAHSSCPVSATSGATLSQVDYVNHKLAQERVRFDHVEIWGGCVRVFVRDGAGNGSMIYFSSMDPQLVPFR